MNNWKLEGSVHYSMISSQIYWGPTINRHQLGPHPISYLIQRVWYGFRMKFYVFSWLSVMFVWRTTCFQLLKDMMMMMMMMFISCWWDVHVRQLMRYFLRDYYGNCKDDFFYLLLLVVFHFTWLAGDESFNFFPSSF